MNDWINGTKTFDLAEPITVEGRLMTRATVRRPRARDMVVIEALPEYEPFLALQNGAIKMMGMQERLQRRGTVGKGGDDVAQTIEREIDKVLDHLAPLKMRALSFAVVARLSDLPEKALDELSLADLETLSGAVLPFVLDLGQGFGTGSPASPGSANGAPNAAI